MRTLTAWRRVFAGVFMVIGLGAMSIVMIANRGDLGAVIISSSFGLLFAGIDGGTPYWGVRAIQIIKERCTSKNSSYYSYELNLVLEDGKRLNVVDHGNLERLREDASRLAAFLGKPVWDGT